MTDHERKLLDFAKRMAALIEEADRVDKRQQELMAEIDDAGFNSIVLKRVIDVALYWPLYLDSRITDEASAFRAYAEILARDPKLLDPRNPE